VPESMQRNLKIPNGCIDIGFGFDRSQGYLAVHRIVKDVLQGRIPSRLGNAVLSAIGDIDGLATGIYRRLTTENVFWFSANFEQTPNPDSRVTLSSKRDALGLRRVQLDWRLLPIDKQAVRLACRILGEELARLGIARMRMDKWLLAEDATWEEIRARWHQMGTTRMSDDSARGVVDRDCRVHGIRNLYVAGSSVFATTGYANPTLTIVALALRLADLLRVRA
jgi:choline dehydrogenase-like flavoprotein